MTNRRGDAESQKNLFRNSNSGSAPPPLYIVNKALCHKKVGGGGKDFRGAKKAEKDPLNQKIRECPVRKKTRKKGKLVAAIKI